MISGLGPGATFRPTQGPAGVEDLEIEASALGQPEVEHRLATEWIGLDEQPENVGFRCFRSLAFECDHEDVVTSTDL